MIARQVSLDRASDEGLSRQLFMQLRGLIETSKLGTGMVLPPTRQLASSLGVGRNTVISAYEQLTLEGYLETDGRRGTRVSQATTGFERWKDRKADPVLSKAPLRLSTHGRRLIANERPVNRLPSCFQTGLPEVRSFPHDLWARLLRRAARHLVSKPALGGYDDYVGLPELKRAILDRIAISRGVVAEPEQVIILSSAQAAMDLVTRMLLEPRDIAMHEEPGYGGVLACLEAFDADLRPIPVLAPQTYQRLDESIGEQETPRLIYATPSHQFPTGRVMPLEDRLSLLEFAASHGAFVLEDDYDSEFHFAGAPISCLQGLDRNGLVIYMGTFSKSFMPSLRVAYLILPPALVEPFGFGLRNTGAVPSHTTQLALASFLEEGHFKAHLREMTRLYRERRDALFEALQGGCGRFLKPVCPEGGIQMTALLTDACLAAGWTDSLLADRLAQYGMECSSLSTLYWSGGREPQQGLFLGYAASNVDEIRRGVNQIARILSDETP